LLKSFIICDAVAALPPLPITKTCAVHSGLFDCLDDLVDGLQRKMIQQSFNPLM